MSVEGRWPDLALAESKGHLHQVLLSSRFMDSAAFRSSTVWGRLVSRSRASQFLTAKREMQTERNHTMGDKGGKKDKNKSQKQKVNKQKQKEKKKQDKQQKSNS